MVVFFIALMTITLAILSILLTVALIAKELIHYKERQDMLDRLMSRSFTEYKDTTRPEDNDYGKEDEDITDLENAREDIINADKD